MASKQGYVEAKHETYRILDLTVQRKAPSNPYYSAADASNALLATGPPATFFFRVDRVARPMAQPFTKGRGPRPIPHTGKRARSPSRSGRCRQRSRPGQSPLSGMTSTGSRRGRARPHLRDRGHVHLRSIVRLAAVRRGRQQPEETREATGRAGGGPTHRHERAARPFSPSTPERPARPPGMVPSDGQAPGLPPCNETLTLSPGQSTRIIGSDPLLPGHVSIRAHNGDRTVQLVVGRPSQRAVI